MLLLLANHLKSIPKTVWVAKCLLFENELGIVPPFHCHHVLIGDRYCYGSARPSPKLLYFEGVRDFTLHHIRIDEIHAEHRLIIFLQYV